MTTLINQGKTTCDANVLTVKSDILETHSDSRCTVEHTSKELCILKQDNNKTEKLIGMAVLPLQGSTLCRIRRLLKKLSIKTVQNPIKKTLCMLRLVKDGLGLKVSQIHSTPCECGIVYKDDEVSQLRVGLNNVPDIYIYINQENQCW